MEAFKHTPGPWRRDAFSSGHENMSIVADNPFGDGSWEVAQAITWGGDGHEQAEHNARLIAAAPDFLSACIGPTSEQTRLDWLAALVADYRDMLEEHEHEDPTAALECAREAEELLNSLRAACQKATGEA
jgi:hypothetical protein